MIKKIELLLLSILFLVISPILVKANDTQEQGVVLSATVLPNQATAFFVTDGQDMPPNRMITLRVDSGVEKITYVKLKIKFDNKKLQLNSEINLPIDTKFTNVINKTSMNEANATGLINLELGIKLIESRQLIDASVPSGIFDIVSFDLATVSQTEGDITELAIDVNNSELNKFSGGRMEMNPLPMKFFLNQLIPEPTKSFESVVAPTKIPLPFPVESMDLPLTVSIGNYGEGKNIDALNGNYLVGSRIAVGFRPLRVNKVKVAVTKVDENSNNLFSVSIFEDINGVPGRLIAVSEKTLLNSNKLWQTANLNTKLDAGHWYWLIYNSNSSDSLKNNLLFDMSRKFNGVYSLKKVIFENELPNSFGKAVINTKKYSIFVSGLEDF